MQKLFLMQVEYIDHYRHLVEFRGAGTLPAEVVLHVSEIQGGHYRANFSICVSAAFSKEFRRAGTLLAEAFL